MNRISSPDSLRKLLPGILAGLLLAVCAALLTSWYYLRSVPSDIKVFLKNVGEIERGYVTALPIYEDYATPVLEGKLRTYLFPQHYAAAQKSGVLVDDQGSIAKLVAAGVLVKLEQGNDRLYYFYNVRDTFRYLTSAAAAGLEGITRRFQQNISSRKDLPPVKIAISSVLRPESYQNSLRGRNMNATMVSTHSYGVSFDIFFDDYFVALPVSEGGTRVSRAVISLLRPRLGFLLGDALKSQFRTILMETLIQLQDEGVLYAILERNQHCYHVTILNGERPIAAGAK